MSILTNVIRMEGFTNKEKIVDNITILTSLGESYH